jgi:hypothetical protein
MKIKFSNIKIKKNNYSVGYAGSSNSEIEINYDIEIECDNKAEFLNFFNDPEVRKSLNI